MQECLSEPRSSLITEYEPPPPASLLAGLFPRKSQPDSRKHATPDVSTKQDADASTVDDDPPIESTHISYILIQCKNYSSGRASSLSSPFNLVGINPVDAGVEEVKKRECRYIADDRPYISLAMFFNHAGESELRAGLFTYPDRLRVQARLGGVSWSVERAP